MRAWTSPEVPELGPRVDGAAMIRVHDTSTGTVRPTQPGEVARMYVCGITPYDATHVGHAATYVGFDLLNRVWRDAGHRVHYVQNVTDVDDPLLERAHATGVDWGDLAVRETDLFREDMAALRVLAPDELIGAVESIALDLELIERLRALGHIYEVEQDLYYDVHADPRFGEVSGLDEEAMLALYPDRGGDPDRPGKKHPLDCLVWRGERPGEPAWPSSFGPGRPGWHIECSAIALRYLGTTFDVQGGGSDLAFPHHEMSAGHAQAAFKGVDFARAYVHAGMVAYEGEKMSKSRGNLVFVSRLRADGVDPMAIRLALLRHHYRSDWEWTEDELTIAQEWLDDFRLAAGEPAGAASGPVVAAVREALADELDAPTAVAAIREWAGRTNEGSDRSETGAGSVVRTLLDSLLGILL